MMRVFSFLRELLKEAQNNKDRRGEGQTKGNRNTKN